MSLFGVAALPLAKTFASLVMATSVGVAGISDAVVFKTTDADQIKKYPSDQHRWKSYYVDIAKLLKKLNTGESNNEI